jgi:hypothetical protein
MPSPFAVLAESPAKRRARRVALLKAQAAAESGTTSPGDESAAPEEEQAVHHHETLAEPTEPRTPTDPTAHRRSFRDASRRQLSQSQGSSSTSTPPPPPPPPPPPAFFSSMFGQMGAVLTLWNDDGDKARGGEAGGGPTAVAGREWHTSVADQVLGAAQGVSHGVRSIVDETIGGRGRMSRAEEAVVTAMRTLPARRVLAIWRNAIAERRERARRFRQANADGVHSWLLEWRVRIQP